MSSTVLAYVEVVIIVTTALVIGIMIYQVKKRYREVYTVVSGIISACGFVICIIMSSLEKDRLAESFAVWSVIVLYMIMVVFLLVIMITKKVERPGRDAIIEAFDKIDIGVCYYDYTGRIVLCNEYMHELSIKAFGKRVLNGPQFKEKLQSSWNETDTDSKYEIQIDNKYYSVHIGTIEINNDVLNELMMVDITNLKDRKKELESDNNKLTEINKRLNEYGDIADTVIKEQEILNAKILVHDRFGHLLLTTKHAIEEQFSEEELIWIIDHIKSTLMFMKPGENSYQEDYLKELLKTADSIGVQIHMVGSVPKKENIREIMILAIRECLTNTVKHANGHKLYVAINCTDKTYIRIVNDGDKPEKTITYGTGLSSLKSKVDKVGGGMNISTDNGFVLEIEL